MLSEQICLLIRFQLAAVNSFDIKSDGVLRDEGVYLHQDILQVETETHPILGLVAAQSSGPNQCRAGYRASGYPCALPRVALF